jgi:hypothetical protein
VDDPLAPSQLCPGTAGLFWVPDPEPFEGAVGVVTPPVCAIAMAAKAKTSTTARKTTNSL